MSRRTWANGWWTAVLLVVIGCTRPPVRYLDPAELPDGYRTRAERSGYAETSRYDEVVAFCRRLAEHAPQARYTECGASGAGRPMPLLILSRERAFTPAAARRAGHPVVLIQCCIHAGECAGKEAALALARDMVVTGTQAERLEGVTVLILPTFNLDGHERVSAYNRVNQNGPRAMGWRTTGTNLNLNRDYTKADSAEMRAWLEIWRAWQPDLLVDTHTTDGSDHRYDLMYAGTADALLAEPLAAWMRAGLLPEVQARVEAAGYRTFPYGEPRDAVDLAQGINVMDSFEGRYSTGYSALCNRPAILLEAHALKPFERRVKSTYEFLGAMLEVVQRDADHLREMIRSADARCAQLRGGEHDGEIVLRLEATDESRPITYHGVRAARRASDVLGAEVLTYTDEPLDVETRLYDRARVAATVTPPAAYLVPPQYEAVIERLARHGVALIRLEHERVLDVGSYRFEDVSFAPRPYESHQIPEYRVVPIEARRAYGPGTVVVPMDQPRAKLAAHLLEPEGPDSLVAWGFFNAIFEQKEYAETYVFEPIARRMLAADPALRAEFEARLAADEEFAGSPGRRLRFFYERSPFWDEQYNVYPIGRLMDPTVLADMRHE